LNVEEFLETLRPYIENKFLTEQEKGKTTQKLRRESNGKVVASAKKAETLLSAAVA
jgi:hypothetical protein